MFYCSNEGYKYLQSNQIYFCKFKFIRRSAWQCKCQQIADLYAKIIMEISLFVIENGLLEYLQSNISQFVTQGRNKLFYLISRIKKYITIHQLECFEFVSLDTLLCLPTPKIEIIATSWKTTIHISWKWSTTHWMEQGWPRTNNSTITIYAYTHTYT